MHVERFLDFITKAKNKTLDELRDMLLADNCNSFLKVGWEESYESGDIEVVFEKAAQLEEPELALKVLGILWCYGSAQEKAKCLWDLIHRNSTKERD